MMRMNQVGAAARFSIGKKTLSPPPYVAPGYNLAAVIAAVRADPIYGSVWSDTSDPMAPAGLALPTAPQGTLTTVNVSSLADLNTNIANGRHIILAPGSYTQTPASPVLNIGNIQDLRITLTGCTIAVNKSIASASISTNWRARRIEILDGTFDGGYRIGGKHIKIKGTAFVVPTTESSSTNEALVEGSNICWERTTHQMDGGGPLWCSSSVQALVSGTISGGVFTCTYVEGDPIAAGMCLEFQSGGAFPGQGIIVTGQLTGAAGSTGTYSVNRTAASTTASANFFTTVPATNVIFANSNGLETRGTNGNHENLARVFSGQFILAVDSRMASVTDGTAATAKAAFRMMAHGPSGSSVKTIMALRTQMEGAGVWVSSGAIGAPLVEKLYIDACRIYRTTGAGAGGVNGGAALDVNYNASWFQQIGNGASMSSDGTTITVGTENQSAPNTLQTGDVIDIVTGESNFAITGATITKTGEFTFTFAKTSTAGTATGGFTINSTAYRGVEFFYMKNTEVFSAPDIGTNGVGWTSGSAIGSTWTTVYPDAATAATNGNYYRTWVTPPAWSFQ